MAKAEIDAGVCGYKTVVFTRMEGENCKITIQSECKAITRLGEALTEVNPLQEITFRNGGPVTLQLAAQFCAHTACLVPVAILKAVEIEAGLNLPADVTIKLSKT